VRRRTKGGDDVCIDGEINGYRLGFTIKRRDEWFYAALDALNLREERSNI